MAKTTQCKGCNRKYTSWAEMARSMHRCKECNGNIFLAECKNLNGHCSSCTISKAQELHLQLIEITAHNELPGKEIAEDLRTYRERWEAVMMSTYDQGLLLRDLKVGDGYHEGDSGYFHADTLYITPEDYKEDKKALEDLGKKWNADEIDWITDDTEEPHFPSTMYTRKPILRLWWD